MPAPDPLRRRLLALGAWPLAALAHAGIDYPEVVKGKLLSFPRDEGAHPAFRNEWWYVTGWLRDADAREYGFQVTLFRNRPGIAEDNPSRFAPRQLLFAHAAIADPGIGRLRSDQRAAREGFGLAGASTAATDVHIGDWSLVETPDTAGGADHAPDRYRARVRGPDFDLDLALAATSPVMLQGEAGLSRKGPDPADASYYYSRPQLEVSGTISLGADARRVRGIAWLDHEWSSHYLTAGAVGWDWTGLNLDDGGALMAFRIRDRTGAALWAGATLRDAAGRQRSFAPPQVRFAPLQHWRSPRTGIEYPIAMRVQVGDLAVDLEPLMPDQELDARASVGVVYWEGAARAAIGGRGAGRGYLELTGYGEPLRL